MNVKRIRRIRKTIVHIDCDLYESAMQCCEGLYYRMHPGGIMIFDDYGFIGEPGVKLAVDEFFQNKLEEPNLLPTGQGMVIKMF